MKRVTVLFDDRTLYREAKAEAVREGRVVKDVVAEALTEWLRRKDRITPEQQRRRQEALRMADELRARQPPPLRAILIVVDASLALKLVLDEPGSGAAREKWRYWSETGEVLVAPVLFRSETLCGLRRSVYSRRLSREDGSRAYAILDELAVESRDPPNLYGIAWQLAERFGRPTVYDCRYVALAAIAQCELWTGDKRLANAAGRRLDWLHLLEA